MANCSIRLNNLQCYFGNYEHVTKGSFLLVISAQVWPAYLIIQKGLWNGHLAHLESHYQCLKSSICLHPDIVNFKFPSVPLLVPEHVPFYHTWTQSPSTEQDALPWFLVADYLLTPRPSAHTLYFALLHDNFAIVISSFSCFCLHHSFCDYLLKDIFDSLAKFFLCCGCFLITLICHLTGPPSDLQLIKLFFCIFWQKIQHKRRVLSGM